jgi:hypothetical protein
MNTTLILEPTNEADLQQLLRLAQQLGVKATTTPAVATMSAEERRQRFLNLAGSWQSDESGDEINQMLRDSRHFRDRDVEL